MQKNKRLRVFAGPNGSGKSTLFNEFSKIYNTGYFINADQLESQLSNKGLIDLSELGLKATQGDLDKFLGGASAQSLIKKASNDGHSIDISIKENFIVDREKDTHSYEGSLIAAFIRHLLMEANKSFSFETVMSHFGKLDEIREAKQNGYKIYLYFICIDSPLGNIERVGDRVAKGGHYVDVEKIVERYPKTLGNLFSAIQIADRAYLFDNSGSEQPILIAEVFEGAMQLNVDDPPNWFIQYVLPHFIP